MDESGFKYTFNAEKSIIESNYPSPIANVFRKCRLANKHDLGGRHKNVIDLFETFIKFLCILQLQELRQVFPDIKSMLPQKEKTLEFLKRPSLGQWVGLLRILSNLDIEYSKTIWAIKIANWYKEGRNDENINMLKFFGGIRGVNFETRTKTPNSELCNAFVTYRNKQLAHSANIVEQETIKRLPILENVITYLLKSASFLEDLILFHTARIEISENKRFIIHASKLRGINEEPLSFITIHKMELSELYIKQELESEDATNVTLSPFILWRMNEERKRSEIFFYNDAWRTKLEYLSYNSGSYYYHKELHSVFEDFITLKIKPGVEEDIHRTLSQEERQNQAEKLFKRSLLLLDQGQMEEAIASLENAIEFDRRADLFLEMAKIQKSLNDPEGIIRQTLQNCLDLEPNNVEAHLILKSLTELSSEDEDEEEVTKKDQFKMHQVIDDNSKTDLLNKTSASSVFTYLQAFMFPRFRKNALYAWMGIFLLWYIPSVLIEFLTGNSSKIYAIIVQIAVLFSGFAVVHYGKERLLRLKIPLSFQLDAMRLERFDEWFRDRMNYTFGIYSFKKNGKPDYRKTFWKEKYFYTGFLIYLLVWAILGSIIIEIYKDPFLLFVKRLLDNLLVFGVMTYFTIRYVVGVTGFLFRFSKLSLKPMLTKLSNDGLRAFGSVILYNISMVLLIWSGLIIIAYLEVVSEFYLEFVLVFAGLVVVFIWSIGLPLAMRKAAIESKNKTIYIYSETIEKAFQQFLKDPANDSLDRYNWLLKNQKVIKRIPTWPFSLAQTIFVVFVSNIFTVFMTSRYILSRLGYLNEVVDYIKHIF
jgi:hypothetical protein